MSLHLTITAQLLSVSHRESLAVNCFTVVCVLCDIYEMFAVSGDGSLLSTAALRVDTHSCMCVCGEGLISHQLLPCWCDDLISVGISVGTAAAEEAIVLEKEPKSAGPFVPLTGASRCPERAAHLSPSTVGAPCPQQALARRHADSRCEIQCSQTGDSYCEMWIHGRFACVLRS